ncbi:MAG: hypothetical protein P4L28_05490 [Paludibacteraceae bacterium]|nr:hypothetical protein [Paludibacteraceae bacterium]
MTNNLSAPTSESIRQKINVFPTNPLVEEKEEKEYDREAKLARFTLQTEILRDDKGARKKYARLTFILTCSWSIFLVLTIFLLGLKILTLSDTVIVTLITSTTINFFGFFLLVMQYLFPKENKEKNKDSKL